MTSPYESSLGSSSFSDSPDVRMNSLDFINAGFVPDLDRV